MTTDRSHFADTFLTCEECGIDFVWTVTQQRRLKEQGLARYLGVSNHTRKVFAEFTREGMIDVYHVRYNAVNNGAKKDVFPLLPAENQPGIVTYSATR